jgi:hypothetical protein
MTVTEANISSQNPKGEWIDARVLLNELSPHGVGLYAEEAIPNGTQITLRLEEPKEVILNGKVIWSQESPDQKVISKKRFSLRLGVQFLFATKEEEEAFKAFWEDLQKTHLYAKASL